MTTDPQIAESREHIEELTALVNELMAHTRGLQEEIARLIDLLVAEQAMRKRTTDDR